MDNTFINIVSLAALVFYPPIPLILIFIHRTIVFWRRVGVRSYFVFLALFAAAYTVLLLSVVRFSDSILAWRLYDTRLAFLGIIPLAVAVFFGVKSIKTLSLRVLLGVPEINPEKMPPRLVAGGIYRYVRHPRYLEFMLETAGLAIFSGLAVLFLLLFYMIIMMRVAARAEERELLARFGTAYADYQKTTGQFLPRFGGRGRD